jgi:hypothetical protein
MQSAWTAPAATQSKRPVIAKIPWAYDEILIASSISQGKDVASYAAIGDSTTSDITRMYR